MASSRARGDPTLMSRSIGGCIVRCCRRTSPKPSPGNSGSTCQALEQYGPDRVEVGALVHFEIEQARLLGRDVGAPSRRAGRASRRSAAPSRQAEVDEDRPPERFSSSMMMSDGLIARWSAPRPCTSRRPARRQRPTMRVSATDNGPSASRSWSGTPGICGVTKNRRSSSPELSQARDPGPPDAPQRLGVVFQLDDPARREPLDRDRLDHHPIALRQVDRQQCLQPRTGRPPRRSPAR